MYLLPAADFGDMCMKRDALHEHFFNAAISGDRVTARQMIDQVLDTECSAEDILTQLVWPTVQRVEKLHRGDQISRLAHNYATRLLRSLCEQMQLRLPQHPRNGRRVLLSCGNEQAEELSAQISADLLESYGFELFFCGGGIPNDELVEQIGILQPNVLVIFGAIPATVPDTRVLIDRLHDINVCPHVQIVVGGGVFNRANGLAEEIGADLWATDPQDLVKVIVEQPQRRMTPDQRTVGRKRRNPTRRDAA